MRLAIERAALLRALAHVQSVVERRTTIPILSNIKLEAADGGINLTATDMDLAVVERAEAEIEQAGAATAPAHTLYDVVRKLPEGVRIQMRVESGAELKLRAGRSTFDLPCLPAADFPTMTDEGLEHRFTLTAAELRRLIDKTRFAISTEETRYYLNGIYLHLRDDEAGPGRLRAVATDGHRLARVDIEAPAGAAGMPGVIVPRKTVGEVKKLVDDQDDDAPVEIALSSARIRFGIGGAVLRSRLIDGTYPDYERVIPTQNDRLLVAPRRDLTDAVDRVATIATDKSRAVKLSLADGRLTVSAVSPDAGRAEEELDVAFNGDALEIGFNARYILEMSSQIDGDEVEIAIADPGSPTIVRDPKDASTLYVLMPMRV